MTKAELMEKIELYSQATADYFHDKCQHGTTVAVERERLRKQIERETTRVYKLISKDPLPKP